MFFLRIEIMAGFIRDLQSFKIQFEIRIDGSIVHLELRFQKPKSVFFYLLCFMTVMLVIFIRKSVDALLN